MVLAVSGKAGNDLLAFFHDRLKVYLRDQGARHDLIDAVLSMGANTLPPVGRVDSEAGGVGVGKPSPVGAPPTPGPSPQGGGENTSNDDLLQIVARVKALGAFLETEDGKTLLAGYKRAANIVRAEEKKEKDASAFSGVYAPDAGAPDAEKALAAAVASAAQEAASAIAAEKFESAMQALSKLRAPVDKFFEDVTVNDPDPARRLNRLAPAERAAQRRP